MYSCVYDAAANSMLAWQALSEGLGAQLATAALEVAVAGSPTFCNSTVVLRTRLGQAGKKVLSPQATVKGAQLLFIVWHHAHLCSCRGGFVPLGPNLLKYKGKVL